jgi:serine/threonine protein kinase
MEPSVTGPLEPYRLDGTELAGYEIHSLIGRGGMAYVYRAHDRRLGRTVAVKVLAPELARNEDFRRRFLNESRLAASIDHPNIIPIYEAGESNGQLFIAMRYVEGSDLKGLLNSVGWLEPSRAVHIFSQVAAALDTAHANGLVHRDVKPANILIASGAGPKGREHIYLSDFGLTKRSSSVSGETAAGAVIGTMDYVAPEQIAGKQVDARTDVYALGCVVYQALTGTVPFVRDDEAALLWAHLVESPAPVSRFRPELPPAVHAVIAKAMAKASDDRYESCGQFIAALADELDAQDALARIPTHPGSGAHYPAEFPSPGTSGGEELRGPVSPLPSSGFSAAPSIGPPSGAPAGSSVGASSYGYAAYPPTGSPGVSHPGYLPPPPGPAPVRRRGGRRIGIVVLAAVVAVAVAVTGALFLRSRDTPFVESAADNLVPYSFSRPPDWRRAGAGTNVVFSPRASETLPVFLQPDDPDSWSATRPLLTQDPQNVVGLYTLFVSTRYNGTSPDALQPALRSLLPGRITFTGGAQTTLGNTPATRLDGVLADPGGPGRLRFECYIASLQTAPVRTVHLMFFSAADTFERHRSDFDAIAKSVRMPG